MTLRSSSFCSCLRHLRAVAAAAVSQGFAVGASVPYRDQSYVGNFDLNRDGTAEELWSPGYTLFNAMLVQWLAVWAVIGCFAIAAAHAAPTAVRPNILIVVADDLGWGDLACFGHPEIQTPHLDRLAATGLKLARYYAASPVCSPSRTGMMTGRTPTRVGVYGAIPMLSPMHVPATEVTLAALLQKSGYATAHVGKWHMNGMFNLPGQPQARDQGFGYSFAVQNNALPNHHNPYNFTRNGIPLGPLKGYSGGIVADDAVRWLNEERDKAKPFFLYAALNEPHEPIATDPQYSQRYEKAHPDDPSRVAYYGNVTQMDAALGRILTALEKLGLDQNTLVWFGSDNGPARTAWHNAGSSGGLREFKGHIYDGGIRVPGIVRWPGQIKPGATTQEPICGVDVLPTLCEIAGAAAPQDRTLDGTSVTAVFGGSPLVRTKPLYWLYVIAGSKPQIALRKGSWKILAALDAPRSGRSAKDNEAFHDLIKKTPLTAFELFDMDADPNETHDLAATRPDKLAELKTALKEYHASVQADAPVWPPFEDPRFEDARIEWPTYRAKPLPGKTGKAKSK